MNWIPVSVALPRNGIEVLVTSKIGSRFYFFGEHLGNGMFLETVNGHSIGQPGIHATHWALIVPPVEDNAE